MSKNIAYNDDSSFLSNIMMTGILGAGATAGVMAFTSPEKLDKLFNGAVNFVAPKTREGLSEIREGLASRNIAFNEVEDVAKKRKKATYEAREERRLNIIKTVRDNGGEVRPLKMEGDEFAETVNRIEASMTNGTKPHHLYDIKVNKLEEIPGGDKMLEALNNATGQSVKAEELTFKGTAFEYPINGEKQLIPASVFHDETRSWVTNEAGRYSVAPRTMHYTHAPNGKLGINIVNPNTAFADMFRDVSGQGVIDAAVRINDQFAVRDEMERIAGNRKGADLDNIRREAKKAVEKVRAQTEGIRGNKELMDRRLLKEAVSAYKKDFTSVTGTNLYDIELAGRKFVANQSNLYYIEKSSNGKREGFAAEALTISKRLNTFGADQRTPSYVPEGIKDAYQAIPDARNGLVPFTVENTPIEKLHGGEYLRSNFAITPPQAQTAKKTFSSLGFMTPSPSVDINKSLTKGYTFTRPASDITFERNRGRFAESVQTFSHKFRSQPLIWSPQVAENSPNVYGQFADRSIINIPAILGSNDMEEAILTHKDVAESMQVQKEFSFKVKKVFTGENLPSESYVKYKTLETRANGKQFIKRHYGKKTLGEIYEDPELLNKVVEIWGSGNEIVGFGDPSGQINSVATSRDVINRGESLIKPGRPWKQTRQHIDATLLQRKAQLEYGSDLDSVFYASMQGYATKTGSAFGQTRSALEYMSDKDMRSMQEVTNRLGLLVQPEEIHSPKLYEKMLTVIKDGQLVSGKNRSEMFPFVVSSIVGHLNKGQDITLEGALKDRFTNLLTNPEGFTGKLTPEQMQFNLRNLDEDGAATLLQVLGAQRKNYTASSMKISDENMPYEAAVKQIADDLNGDRKGREWLLMNTSAPHESQIEMGYGSNEFRIGLNDSIQYLPESWLKEFGVKNLAETRQINTDLKLMVEGFNKDMRPELEQLGMPILDHEGIKGALGNLTNKSDVSIPGILENTFLSTDVNPIGFGIRAENGNVIPFGSAHTYGGGQYLHEEEKLAIQRNTRVEIEALMAANENGGVLPKDWYWKLSSHRKRNYTHTGEGALAMGAITVEGAEYGMNTSEANWLNNKDIWKKIEGSGSEELKNLYGNMGLLDIDTYRRNTFNEIDTAMIMSQKSGGTQSVHDVLNEMYGENNFFSKYIEGKNITNQKEAMSIAEEITKDMAYKGQRVEEAVLALGSNPTKQQVSDLTELIKQGQTAAWHRFPSEGEASTTFGFLFAKNLNGEKSGTAMALGPIARINMNADNDGDKIFTMLGHMFSQVKANMDRIMGTQRIASEYMQIFKKKPLLAAAMGTNNASFQFPEKGQLSSLLESMEGSEVESAIAASLTKAATGSAHYRAHEIQNALIEDIMANPALKGESLQHAKSFAYALPGQTIVQRAISSKDTEAIIKAMGSKSGKNVEHKIESIISNIGKVDKKQFMQGIANLSGDMGPFAIFTAINGSRKGKATWLNPAYEDNVVQELDTLMNINATWKRAGEDEFLAMHKALGTDQVKARSLWSEYDTQAQQFVDNGGRFMKERAELVEAGFGKFENIRDLYSHYSEKGAGSLSDQHEMALKQTEETIANLIRENKSYSAAEIYAGELSKVRNTSKSLGRAVIEDTRTMAMNELAVGKESRAVRYSQELRNVFGQIRPRHIAGATALGLVAMTALNLLGGDGTPEDPNDLPSVNNPSFGAQKYGSMPQMKVLNSPVSSNMSMDLITGSNSRMDDTLHSVSAMFNGGRYNTVAVKSDGSNPYQADMFKYTN